jgi:serine/threonine-protein kinase RIO1
VRNRDISARSVLIEHPIREGWKLVKGLEPAESSANFYRFRLNADAKKTSTLTVKEYHPILRRYEINNLNEGMLAFFVTQKSINRDVEKVLREILARKNAIATLDAELSSYKEKNVAIAEDQQRLRENMKALKGSAEEKSLVERYAREMNEQEDRVQSLRKALEETKQKREATQKTLKEEIAALQFDVMLQE